MEITEKTPVAALIELAGAAKRCLAELDKKLSQTTIPQGEGNVILQEMATATTLIGSIETKILSKG